MKRNIFLLPLVALLLAPHARAQVLCFEGAVNYAAGSIPLSVFAADLDGDGDQDLAVANYGGSVSILNNNGDGTYATAVNYAAGSHPWSVFAADVDGDADRDVVVANWDGNVSVLKNSGDGTFASPVNYGTGSVPYSVFAADLDGDGNQDLAVANSYSASVSVLINCVHIPQVLRVPQSYASIQAAINAALDGDTVLVAPGVYAEAFNNQSKNLFITSSGGPSVTFVTPAGGRIVLDGDIGTTVEGFSFQGPASLRALRISGSGTFSVTNCRFWDFDHPIYSSATVHISRCLIRNYIGNAIVTTGSGSTIENNTITSGERGLAIYGVHSVIRNNIVINQSWYGIWTIDPSSTLDYNDFWNNQPDYGGGTVAGVHDLSGDPKLCDTVTSDYSIASNSPCVGTGEGGVDIGAFGIGCVTPAPAPPRVLAVRIGPGGDSLHLTDHSPLFSWVYYDQQSRPLIESEVEVGTDNDWAVAEMWQPPTISGPDTSIQYAGLLLVDGATYYVRVRVFNDTLWSQWNVARFRVNSVPTAPIPLSPSNGAVALTDRPNLVVMNAIDAEGDPRLYDFEVYRDSALTLLVDSALGVFQGSGQTEWKTDSLTAENQCHWWRARASDAYENGPWSDVQSFWVDAYNQPPAMFNLQSPANGASVHDPTASFAWEAASDPDPGAVLTYTLTLAVDPAFNFKAEVSGIAALTYEWPYSLTTGTTYWWEVLADDGRGGTVPSAVRSFKIAPLGDLTGDGIVDVFDALFLISYTFSGGSPPDPSSLADVNGDCVVDVFDVIYLINHVFNNGPAPVAGCAAAARSVSDLGGRK